jgi:hypothetical protein
VQPTSHAVGVAALVKQAQHMPQVRADQMQQCFAAHLVIHSAQPGDDVIKIIDYPNR